MNFCKPLNQFLLVLFLIFIGSGQALADDGKMISSAMCKAMTPNGVEYLMHKGSSLLADGTAVTVVCPIIKDRIGKKLKSVEVRYKRRDSSYEELHQAALVLVI